MPNESVPLLFQELSCYFLGQVPCCWSLRAEVGKDGSKSKTILPHQLKVIEQTLCAKYYTEHIGELTQHSSCPLGTYSLAGETDIQPMHQFSQYIFKWVPDYEKGYKAHRVPSWRKQSRTWLHWADREDVWEGDLQVQVWRTRGVSHTQSSTDLDSYQEFKFGKGWRYSDREKTCGKA